MRGQESIARLSKLKLSMTATILLVGIVFVVFLGVLMFAVNLLWELSPLEMYGVAAIGSGMLVIIEYLAGRSIVRSVTSTRYLNPGKNPWLEQTVAKRARREEMC